jgi:hypothetical protein
VRWWVLVAIGFAVWYFLRKQSQAQSSSVQSALAQLPIHPDPSVFNNFALSTYDPSLDTFQFDPVTVPASGPGLGSPTAGLTWDPSTFVYTGEQPLAPARQAQPIDLSQFAVPLGTPAYGG